MNSKGLARVRLAAVTAVVSGAGLLAGVPAQAVSGGSPAVQQFVAKVEVGSPVNGAACTGARTATWCCFASPPSCPRRPPECRSRTSRPPSVTS